MVKQLTACAILMAAATSASAAVLTLDVRLPGGGKTAGVSSPSQVVTMELWAVVQNLDGNRANDGFQLSHGGLTSVEGGTPLLGDLSPVTFSTPFVDTSVSSVGTTLATLDANPDLEVGSLDPTVAAGWIVASTGTASKAGVGAGSGATEFQLGTFTWTAPAVLAGGTTDVNFFPRIRTSGTAAAQLLFKFTSDGTVYSIRGDDAQLAMGAPVTIAVPEPATMGLMGLGSLALLRRKRTAR